MIDAVAGTTTTATMTEETITTEITLTEAVVTTERDSIGIMMTIMMSSNMKAREKDSREVTMGTMIATTAMETIDKMRIWTEYN